MRGSAAFRTGVAPGGALAPGWVKNELWRKARTVPSLDLRFAENKSLVDAVTGAQLVTFTRASSGTFVGSDGLLKTAVTNLLLRSEEFDNASWSGAGGAVASAGSSIAPNGTATADTLTDTNGTTASPFVFQTVTLVDSTTYTMSCYLKAGTKSTARLGIRDKSGTGLLSNFDLSAGTTTIGNAISSSIQSVGNGWYRCVVTAGSSTGATSQRALIYIDTASYTADGTGTILVWGAQLEQSATVGEYIPTTSTINSAPRFDHNPTTGKSLGLLPEEARTNLLLQSEDLATTWTPGTGTVITTNTWTAPDGTLTGDQFTVGTVSTAPSQNVTVAASSSYTLSFYLNTLLTTSAFLRLRFSTLAASTSAFFNVSTLAFGTLNGITNPTVQRVGTNVYKLSVTFAYDAVSAGSRAVAIGSVTTDNGSTPDTGKIVAIWGMQYELGAFASSYIPTTTATVTRAADVASISGSNFSSWYRQDEGTVFSEFSAAAYSTASLAISDGTNNNRIMIDRGSTGTRYVITNAGIAQSGGVQTPYTLNSFAKASIAFALNNCNLAINGLTQTVDTSVSIPSAVDRLLLGVNASASGYGNGPIKRVTFWPTRLSDTTLQQITQ